MKKEKMKKNGEKTPDQELFISRELSWIDFNSRVLDEALTPANPLLERLKFIAIFSSNLDEFFMVRIAGLRQLVKMDQDRPDPAGNRPSEQLAAARRKLERLLKRQSRALCNEILPALESCGVRLRKPAELSATVRAELAGYFRLQVLPVLTPLAVDQAHPFPILNSGAIEIAVSMRPADRGKLVYAFVEVPEGLPRFVEVPDNQPGRTFVLLEELIMDNLGSLFTGCELEEFFPFRITRDMDFSVEDEGAEDLLQSIEKKLLQRRHREPIRLEVPVNTRGALAEWLADQFRLDDQFRYASRAPLHLKQFFELVAAPDCPNCSNRHGRRSCRLPSRSINPSLRRFLPAGRFSSRRRFTPLHRFSGCCRRRRMIRTCWRSSRPSTGSAATLRWCGHFSELLKTESR